MVARGKGESERSFGLASRKVSAPKDGAGAGRRRRAALWKHHELWIALSRMPEWEQFETEDQRQQAYHQIRREALDFKRAAAWCAMGAMVAVFVAAKWGLAFVDWPERIEDTVFFLVLLLAISVIVWFFYRREARPMLRRKLIEFGLPVCMKCGYSLKGLTPSHQRCPECGHAMGEAALRLLAPGGVD